MSMSYHKLSNLWEIFQGDLNQKLMEGIISHDFMDQPCNCNCVSKFDGKCAYNGECRKMCVVYKAPCKIHQGGNFWNQNDSFLSQNDRESKRSFFDMASEICCKFANLFQICRLRSNLKSPSRVCDSRSHL